MINRWGVQLPEARDLPALPKRVILHWTGGGSRANEVDRKAYHYVVNADVTVAQGLHPVAANMRKVSAGAPYAQHTGGFNSFSVGLSAAGMQGYVARNAPGRYPLTEAQIRRLCQLAAYFCDLAHLDPRDPKALFTHQEAWSVHRVKGTQNHQKSDIEFLPYAPELSPNEVGRHLRQLTYELMEEAALPIPVITPKVVIPAKPRLVAEPPHLAPIHPPTPEAPMPEPAAAAPVVVTPKPKASSRTLWLGASAVVIGVGSMAGDALNVARSAGISLPENIERVLLVAVGLGTMVLRFKTSAPLEGTKAAEEAAAP